MEIFFDIWENRMKNDSNEGHPSQMKQKLLGLVEGLSDVKTMHSNLSLPESRTIFSKR